MKKFVSFETNIAEHPITLTQIGSKFIVSYGKEISGKLSYSEAAAKLGGAIMHGLACEGKIENNIESPKKPKFCNCFR